MTEFNFVRAFFNKLSWIFIIFKYSFQMEAKQSTLRDFDVLNKLG